MGKLHPTKGVLLKHYLRPVVQARILHEAMKPRINDVDLYRDCYKRRHSSRATTGCVSSNCATRSYKNAARMVSLARICVVAATNFVKILIRMKF